MSPSPRARKTPLISGVLDKGVCSANFYDFSFILASGKTLAWNVPALITSTLDLCAWHSQSDNRLAGASVGHLLRRGRQRQVVHSFCTENYNGLEERLKTLLGLLTMQFDHLNSPLFHPHYPTSMDQGGLAQPQAS